MHEITCPHCHKQFTIDEAGYASILKQVRDAEFDQQLHDRLELAEREKRDAVELAKARAAGDMQKAAAAKDAELQELKAKLEAGEVSQKLAVAQAANVLKDEAARKDGEIERLKAELKAAETAKQLAVTTAVSAVEKQRDDLARNLEAKEAEKKLLEASLKESHSTEIRAKDEQIAYYRDFKAKQSTKMVGESLEQHCEIEFNRLRATAFPKAYFEKDNDARGGEQGRLYLP